MYVNFAFSRNAAPDSGAIESRSSHMNNVNVSILAVVCYDRNKRKKRVEAPDYVRDRP